MPKVKTSFFCQNCGTQHAKWMGQCSSCNEWNTIVEEVVQKSSSTNIQSSKAKAKPQRIEEVTGEVELRLKTNNQELDQVLGGGIVEGSVILLGGEPGIGKSTLSLQIALELGKPVLYVSGEESLNQIKMRASRLNDKKTDCLLFNETDCHNIIKTSEEVEPALLIIDSIQTLHSSQIEAASGSISQIRQSSAELIQYAKSSNTPLIIIGHINKEGHIAGPKILEHMVDVVLQFEGDRQHNYRLLRAKKNRFGSTHELGIFEMTQEGLKELNNPADLLLSKQRHDLSGTAVASSIEGMRPMMLEIQALVSSAVYGTPQRSTTGFNSKRLNMLLAVLEKRLGFKLGAKDVFLNVTGGIKIEDPALDLAVISAILSSDMDISLAHNICFAGEVGLSGEIRPIPQISQRISEAEKLGFKCIIIAAGQKHQKADQIKIIQLEKVEDLIDKLFT
jgi:DNA repair protein RadA/Sms